MKKKQKQNEGGVQHPGGSAASSSSSAASSYASPLAAEEMDMLPEVPAIDPSTWKDYFSEDELMAAVKVFETIRQHRELKENANTHDGFKRLMKAASVAIKGRGKQETKAARKQRKKEVKSHDKQILLSTTMRHNKLSALDRKMLKLTPGPDPSLALEYLEDAAADGAEATATTASAAAASSSAGGADSNSGFSSSRNEYASASSSSTLAAAAAAGGGGGAGDASAAPARTLIRSKKCFICKSEYREVHHFYDQFCPSCAELNWMKRESSVNLEGRVALVTGARVKIGYWIALKLLRCGARVLVQTRFAHDAAVRYAQEPDFNEWKGRLKIYGVDFRDVGSVHRFTARIKATESRLDIVINNAAQTVRKPVGFYEHLLPVESAPLQDGMEALLGNPTSYMEVDQNVKTGRIRSRGGGSSASVAVPTITASSMATNAAPHVEQGFTVEDEEEEESRTSAAAGAGAPPGATPGAAISTEFRVLKLSVSAALSQLPMELEDQSTAEEGVFPVGQLDEDGQQLDLRRENSWVKPLGEVSSTEYMECHLINATAPFIINSELKELMVKMPEVDKYIVNVSAMEGQFYRSNKTAYHPHTNMAKAALNMMTRTSANSFAKLNIFMTAVDTGWITDENPLMQHKDRMASAPPPLDNVDAAMRVLDPIFTGIADPSQRLYNVFLKDYMATRW